MTSTLLQELSSYFNNMDPEDPVFQKELIRPAEIKEDVKLMEQRKRVTNIMRSKLFKKNLENIFKLGYTNDDVEGECTSTLSLADISEQLLLSALPKNKIENLYQLSQKKGVVCINDLHYGSNSPYEQQERLSRCKLASVFRLIDMYGWSCGFNVTMTARPFRDKEQFLINPFGLMLHEITASSLLSLDFKGIIFDFGSTVLDAHPLNWLIHSAIYSSRPDTRAILHLRTPASLSVSSFDHGLLPLSNEAIILGDVIRLEKLPEIEHSTKNTSLMLADLKNYLTSLLTSKLKVLILPNNGFLICADTIEEGWHLLTNCQQACETQMKLGNLSMDELFIPSKHVQDSIFNQWRNTDLGGIQKSGDLKEELHLQWRIGELEFEALMRHLDNNGYRSGYFYHQENIYHADLSTKSETHKPKYEVEIPPSSISVVNTSKQFDDTAALSKDENKINKLPLRQKTDKWFNTPNSFKLIEENGDSVNNLSAFNFADSQSERKSVKWVSTKQNKFSAPIPQHPVNAGAYVVFGDDIQKSDIIQKDKMQSTINPKELKENQRRVKDKYYHDTNTAGPISCLLDSGLSWDEARRLKNVTLQKQIGPGASSDQIVTAASKAIIQRGHKALVYQDLYKPANPFENVTTDELDSYHKEIDRKLHPDRYSNLESCPKDEGPEIRITASQSEATVKQCALDDDQSSRRPTGVVSETDMTNVDAPEKKGATLAAPGYRALTSETSGPDISQDEGDKEGKAKKKKRRFKFPSFSKKKKDKPAKD